MSMGGSSLGYNRVTTAGWCENPHSDPARMPRAGDAGEWLAFVGVINNPSRPGDAELFIGGVARREVGAAGSVPESRLRGDDHLRLQERGRPWRAERSDGEWRPGPEGAAPGHGVFAVRAGDPAVHDPGGVARRPDDAWGRARHDLPAFAVDMAMNTW